MFSLCDGKEEKVRINLGFIMCDVSISRSYSISLHKNSMRDILHAQLVEIESCRPDPFYHKLRISKYKDLFPFVDNNEIFHQPESPTSSQYTTYDRVIKGTSALQHCLDIWIADGGDMIPDCWGESYAKFIKNYYDTGQAIFVVSNENLALASFSKVDDPETCGAIFNGMASSLGPEFEIEIVFAQRIHFKRMISMFHQEYDGEKLYIKPKLQRWPGEKEGKAIPLLEQYISNFSVDSIIKAIECFKYASEHNPRVSLNVIDFHQRDVLMSFLNILTGDEAVTTQLMSRPGSVMKENTASEREKLVQSDRIAVAAMQRGLLPKTASRKDVRNALSAHFKDNAKSIIIRHKCPSEEFYEELVNATMTLQHIVFPGQRDVDEERKIRLLFMRAVNQRKFCDVDGEAMIEEDTIREFLKQFTAK